MLQLTFNPGLTLTGIRTTRPRSYQYLIKIPLLKLRKARLSLKFLEQKEFVCKT